jgi:hypothetical protein
MIGFSSRIVTIAFIGCGKFNGFEQMYVTFWINDDFNGLNHGLFFTDDCYLTILHDD